MAHDIFIKSELPPRVQDAVIAMRVPSAVVALASIWFTATPLSYYGISLNTPATFNFLGVGGLLLCSSALRLWFPLATVGFSWLNAILGLWVLITPWVFGYSDYTTCLINTICLGVVIVGMSIVSARARPLPGTPLANAYEDRQGLELQDYDFIGPDRY